MSPIEYLTAILISSCGLGVVIVCTYNMTKDLYFDQGTPKLNDALVINSILTVFFGVLIWGIGLLALNPQTIGWYEYVPLTVAVLGGVFTIVTFGFGGLILFLILLGCIGMWFYLALRSLVWVVKKTHTRSVVVSCA